MQLNAGLGLLITVIPGSSGGLQQPSHRKMKTTTRGHEFTQLTFRPGPSCLGKVKPEKALEAGLSAAACSFTLTDETSTGALTFSSLLVRVFSVQLLKSPHQRVHNFLNARAQDPDQTL
ncbi:uncharacterized protein V6R79_008459 [Siganus canaliculatus]